jgi:hypothetical protein
MAGLEWIGHLSLKGFVEGGYVFNRKLRYQSGEGNMDPEPTFMVRGGILKGGVRGQSEGRCRLWAAHLPRNGALSNGRERARKRKAIPSRK